jgi:hypothetical protein
MLLLKVDAWLLRRYIREGGWVFLDNVHLMQGWIPRLERKLEIAAETAHPDFRCFFSAEPINGAPHVSGCVSFKHSLADVAIPSIMFWQTTKLAAG